MADVTVTKRGNVWQYRFDVARVDGKRKQISKSGYRTRAEARLAGAAALSEYKKEGRVASVQNLSVGEYLDQWFKSFCETQLKQSTQLAYLKIIRVHLKPRFDHYFITEVTPAHIQQFVNDLNMHGMSKATIKGIIRVLSGAYSYAVSPLGYVKSNPCREMLYPRFSAPGKNARYVISDEDFQRILDRFPEGNHWHVPLLLGYCTGMRKSEVFSLTWDDIDLDKGVITVSKQVSKRTYSSNLLETLKSNESLDENFGFYFTSTKTKASVRRILIDRMLINALKKLKEDQEFHRKLYGKHYKVIYLKEDPSPSGEQAYRLVEVYQDIPVLLPEVKMLTVKENGTYLSRDSFGYCARVVQNELQIPFNFHSLRHTHATILVQEGANIKDVQNRLGHSSLSTTMNIYAHDTPQMSKESVGIFERHLRKMCTK